MQSIFKLNRVRRAKLRILLKQLFPDYGVTSINSAGVVTFKKKWFSLKREKNTLIELCQTLIPSALAKCREMHSYGNDNDVYLYVITKQIEYDIMHRSTHIIDYIYDEFQKIYKQSKNVYLGTSLLCLPQANNKQIVGIPTSYITKPFCSFNSKIDEISSLLSKAVKMASQKDVQERLSWL